LNPLPEWLFNFFKLYARLVDMTLQHYRAVKASAIEVVVASNVDVEWLPTPLEFTINNVEFTLITDEFVPDGMIHGFARAYRTRGYVNMEILELESPLTGKSVEELLADMKAKADDEGLWFTEHVEPLVIWQFQDEVFTRWSGSDGKMIYGPRADLVIHSHYAKPFSIDLTNQETSVHE